MYIHIHVTFAVSYLLHLALVYASPDNPTVNHDYKSSPGIPDSSNDILHPLRMMVTFKRMRDESFLEMGMELENHIKMNPNLNYERLNHTNSYIIELDANFSENDIAKLVDEIEKMGGLVEMDELLHGNARNRAKKKTRANKSRLSRRLYNKNQWYIPELKLPQAWRFIRRERLKEVKICVIDTGIDYMHDALTDRMYINELELSGKVGVDDDGNGYIDDVYGYNFVDNNADPMDDNGHGTHIAGVIASDFEVSGVAGINPAARIVACKAFDRNLKSRMSNMVRCINYCIEVGANIQNHSWAIFKEKEVIKMAFEAANNKGILMVVSAGNNHYDEDIMSHDMNNTVVIPAIYSRSFPNVLTIANLQHITRPMAIKYIKKCIHRLRDLSLCPSKIIQLKLNDTSMYGYSSVQIAVPGTRIFSLAPNNEYAFMDGTSMATAIMSGICSLVISLEGDHSSFNPKQILQIIRESIQPIHSLYNKVRWEGTVDCKRLVTLSKLLVQEIEESKLPYTLTNDKDDYTDMQIEI